MTGKSAFVSIAIQSTQQEVVKEHHTSDV